MRSGDQQYIKTKHSQVTHEISLVKHHTGNQPDYQKAQFTLFHTHHFWVLLRISEPQGPNIYKPLSSGSKNSQFSTAELSIWSGGFPHKIVCELGIVPYPFLASISLFVKTKPNWMNSKWSRDISEILNEKVRIL